MREHVVENGGLSRRQMLMRSALAAGALTATGAVAACGSDEESGGSTKADSGGGVGQFPSTPKWKFVLVNHVTTNPFFVPTQYGAQDACAIYNCSFQWTGSKTAVSKEMVDAMNTAISGKADGIAVCDTDPKAFSGPINKALDAGIPTLTYNADGTLESKKDRLAYIGQDLFLSGQLMGQRIAEIVDSGKVVIFIATPGQANIQPRADGAIEAIKKAGKDIQVKQVATGAELPEELRRIDSYYQGNKDVKGMFAVDAGSTQGVGQIIEKYKLQGKVQGGGYDLLDKTIEFVDQEILAFTIDQQPYLQGFLPIQQLYMYKLSGSLSGTADVNTGVKFLGKDDVQVYLKNKTRYQGSSDKQQYVQAQA